VLAALVAAGCGRLGYARGDAGLVFPMLLDAHEVAEQRAEAAKQARDAVAKRLEQLRKRRQAIEARAKQLRGQ